MDVHINLEYSFKGASRLEMKLQTKVDHIRFGSARRRLRQRPSKKQSAYMATVISFVRRNKIITTYSRMNPNDKHHSMRSGIIAALVNFVTRHYPVDGGERPFLTSAMRVIDKDFRGYRLVFMSPLEAADKGFDTTNHMWWLESTRCPSRETEKRRDWW